MTDIEQIFAPDGLLAQQIAGFRYRPQQSEMAQAVALLLDEGGVLVVEAGTGTGKTFAYLAPALRSRLKIIVSTGTKNLQDQLFHRDLPLLRDALGIPVRTALLKGRSNYLCHYRLERATLSPRGRTPEARQLLSLVDTWVSKTRSGDLAELTELPEDAPILPLIVSHNDNCLGQECPHLSRCHLLEARKAAQEADLVVINHHLLCADFALKKDGFGELLPDADAIIVDEAHQLPEVAGDFFGQGISGRQLTELCRDAELEYQREAGDVPEFLQRTAVLEKQVRDLRLLLGLENRRSAWREIEDDTLIQEQMDRLREALHQLEKALQALAERGKGLDAMASRATALLTDWDAIFRQSDDGAEDIRWFETFSQGFRFNRTPLDIAEVFSTAMERSPASWVFTSATLAVGNNFAHFERQLGLNPDQAHCWDSPFDYSGQALWYVPRGLPEPSDRDYTKAVVEVSVPVLEASQGRAFLLFTSHRALREAAKELEARLDFPLFIQGNLPKVELLNRFRTSGNGVLLGTASFWEGVDVKGEALSCVIIDKLPFESPGDPVLQARLEAMRRRQQNPFYDHQLPKAALTLKQGAGRLIRDADDRGVLVVCDPRLLKRNGYGQIFLDSMPPFARTRVLADVQAFFANLDTLRETG